MTESNKRDFFRHDFTVPTCAMMKIASIAGKRIGTKSTYICVKNIGAGGLYFASNLDLPLRDDVLFEFDITLANSTIRLDGKLLRKTDGEENEYAVKFCFTGEEERQKLMALLNKVVLATRRSSSNGCLSCSLSTTCYMSADRKKELYHLTM